MVEVLVKIFAQYECPDHKGVFLNHYVEFVDAAPEFLESVDFYASMEGVNVLVLKVSHEDLEEQVVPTHWLDHQLC